METWAFQRACRKVYSSKWNHMTQSLAMFLAATSQVRGKGVGEQNYSQHAADWKFIMVFAHLSKLSSVLCFFAVINTVSPALNVRRDWIQTTFCPFTATGFCVYIVYKDVDRLLSNAIEGQSHHVSSALTRGSLHYTVLCKIKISTHSLKACIQLFGKMQCW